MPVRAAVIDSAFASRSGSNPDRSTDATVKLWSIPDGGLTEKLTDPIATLNGHPKEVTLLQWHPVAGNCLASAGRDMAVRIWDVEHCADKLTIGGGAFGGLISDIRWNYKGELLAASSKDKMVRVFDPRTDASKPVSEVAAHEGAKTVNMTFTGRSDHLITAGFNKTSRREFKIWDPRSMAEPLLIKTLDQSAGVLMPFFDGDSGILYLGGKGDGNLRYYEVEDGAALAVHPVDELKSSESVKGLAMLPKRTVDVGRCETARFVKLTRDKAALVSFIVPRKSDRFQDDLFPDTAAPTPATSAEGWFGGANPEPKMMSMDPEKNGGMTTATSSVTVKSTGKSAAEAKGTSAEASASSAGGAAAASGAGGEADAAATAALNARIAVLEASLAEATAEAKAANEAKAAAEKKAAEAEAKAAAAAGSSGDAAGDDSNVSAELASAREENATLQAQVAKLKRTVATLMDA
jgi:coronin-1B/1C/6